MNVRTLFRVISIGVALWWALPVHAQAVVFRSTETPPYWSATLPNNGFGGSLLRLVSAHAGVNYQIEYQPVKRFSDRAATYIVGDPDLLNARIQGQQRAIFPIGIFRSAFFFYSPHHAVIDIRSMRDMSGHTLGVLRGSIADKPAFVRHGIKVEESDSVDSLLKKLKKGRVDFCILVAGSGRHAVQRLFPNEQDNFPHVIIPGLTRPLAIMIDAQSPEAKSIAKRYRQVLKSALHSPQYQAIVADFYEQDGIPPDWDAQLESFVKQYANTWHD